MDSSCSSNVKCFDDSDNGGTTKIVELLKDVGLNSYAVDPISFDALNDLMRSLNRTNNASCGGSYIKLSRYDADDTPLTENTTMKSTTSNPFLYDTNQPATAPTLDSDSISQNLIWEHMELHTKLLAHLHKRMETISTSLNRVEMTQREELLHRQQRSSSTIEKSQHQNLEVYVPRYTSFPSGSVNTSNVQQQARRQKETGPEQQLNGPAPPQMLVFTLYSNIIKSCQRSYGSILNSRIGKVVRLFIGLRSHRVRNLDFGLIVKVLFMMAIFMYRIQRRGKPKDGGFFSNLNFSTKFCILAFLILTGFLVQNGFIEFIYKFFVKENYAGRILDGEELDVNAVIAEDEAKRVRVNTLDQNENNAERDNVNNIDNNPRDIPFGGIAAIPNGIIHLIGVIRVNINRVNWRQTFLGGAIVPINQVEQERIFFVRIFQDFIFLLGSFFLSIFPMWRPVAQVVEQPQPEVEEVGEPHNEPGLIPRIQPPVDPAAEAEPHED
jgi:hypothetical protein